MGGQEGKKADVRIVTSVDGVVLPTWFAICGLALAFVAAVALVISARALDRMEQEIRILQIHARDVEAVLIRSGHAQRSDFAPWADIQPLEEEETP